MKVPKKHKKDVKKIERRLLPAFLGAVIEKDGKTGKMEIYSPSSYGVKTPISDDVFGFCGQYPWKFSVTLTGENKEGVRETVEIVTLDHMTFDQLNRLIMIQGGSLIKSLASADADIDLSSRIIVIGMPR